MSDSLEDNSNEWGRSCASVQAVYCSVEEDNVHHPFVCSHFVDERIVPSTDGVVTLDTFVEVKEQPLCCNC